MWYCLLPICITLFGCMTSSSQAPRKGDLVWTYADVRLAYPGPPLNTWLQCKVVGVHRMACMEAGSKSEAVYVIEAQ